MKPLFEYHYKKSAYVVQLIFCIVFMSIVISIVAAGGWFSTFSNFGKGSSPIPLIFTVLPLVVPIVMVVIVLFLLIPTCVRLVNNSLLFSGTETTLTFLSGLKTYIEIRWEDIESVRYELTVSIHGSGNSSRTATSRKWLYIKAKGQPTKKVDITYLDAELDDVLSDFVKKKPDMVIMGV